MRYQQTLAEKIEFDGVGIHSGLPSKMVIRPAPEDSGIVFCRVDLPGKPKIPALWSNVADTRNSTTIADPNGNAVSTIEHIMAALSIAGIDNALVEIDSREVPIMDGSARVFYEALAKAPKQSQSKPRRYIEVTKEISFADGKGNEISLKPSPEPELKINFAIDFPSPVVGHQEFSAAITPERFAADISPCRTFCEKAQVDQLRAMGLAKGGSLENTVVLDGDNILNPEGLRTPLECVGHKVLDAVGDLYTAGLRIRGELTARRTGHFHNNMILKKLFATPSNYRII